MKLSFSLRSKSSKPKPSQGITEEKPNHEYVTEFDASKTLTQPHKKKNTIIIPPKENECRPYKKMKNLHLPPIQSADGKPLEFEIESSHIAPSKAVPGSNMSYGLNLRESSGKEGGDDGGGFNSVDALLLKKLKTEEVPVKWFAAALLAGYGWRKGRGIGKNAKEDVKVVEYKRRTAGEGLGFCADHGSSKQKQREIEGKNRRSDQKSKSWSRERKKSKRSREVDGRGDVRQVVKNEKVYIDERRRAKKVSWLRSHIRVRIISKEFKGGRFYLKKGEVVDVAGPMTCDLSMDDGKEIMQGVDQDILETALPKRGGPVLVLLGKHKGTYGSLVDKDTERETGVVQDADTCELLNVRLEQIAEYVGDPSYIGY